jgi:hypothetical protein
MAKRKKKIKDNLNEKLDMLVSGKNQEEYDKEKEEQMSIYRKNCRLVFDYLGKRNIKQIKVVFDGCGDSGQIEDISTDRNKDDKDLLNEMVPFSHINRGGEWDNEKKAWVEKDCTEGTLRELLGEVVYNKLNDDHSGWEINSGSFGTFVFDIKKRKIKLEFNERYEEVNTSEDEETF